eukprot:11133744-Alexandrium_andersonii.AAC.1
MLHARARSWPEAHVGARARTPTLADRRSTARMTSPAGHLRERRHDERAKAGRDGTVPQAPGR